MCMGWHNESAACKKMVQIVEVEYTSTVMMLHCNFWTIHPNSPDLVPSDYHLCGSLRNTWGHESTLTSKWKQVFMSGCKCEKLNVNHYELTSRWNTCTTVTRNYVSTLRILKWWQHFSVKHNYIIFLTQLIQQHASTKYRQLLATSN